MFMSRIFYESSSKGLTSLHEAAKFEYEKVFEMISHELQGKNHQVIGKTPLYLAAKNGHKEIVKMILDVVKDKNLNEDPQCPVANVTFEGAKSCDL